MESWQLEATVIWPVLSTAILPTEVAEKAVVILLPQLLGLKYGNGLIHVWLSHGRPWYVCVCFSLCVHISPLCICVCSFISLSLCEDVSVILCVDLGFLSCFLLQSFCPSPLLSEGCHNKASQTRCLKQQVLILSQLWRLEVPNQSVGKVGCFSGRNCHVPLS